MAVEIVLNDLTTGATNGAGIFDKLMLATKAHIKEEFEKGRIKGPEYATVYLGALDNVMSSSMQFLLQKAAIGLQADLLTQQILLAQIEVQKANIALEIMAIEKLKASATLLQIESQTSLIAQQKVNLAAEALNIPKQGIMLDAQAAQSTQTTANLASEQLGIVARTALTGQQAINAEVEKRVLENQLCKLQAEYELTLVNVTKTTGEITLLAQKVATEKSQILSLGVDADSVVGKQKALYQAQTEGFSRDAEQKAAKLLVDTWSARRMSDEGTIAGKDPANPDAIDNMLGDSSIARVVNKVLSGINA